MDTSAQTTCKVEVFVDDLKGLALNFAVENAKGHGLHPLNEGDPEGQWVAVYTLLGGETFDAPIQNYVESSILAIDLIKDQRLSLKAPDRHSNGWAAEYAGTRTLYRAEDFALEVAVARCYVKSKRGEKVWIPLTILNRKGN